MTFDCYGRRLTRRKAALITVPVMWFTFVVMLTAATPTCSRFITTTVLVRVKNTVSKTTAAAWASWATAHPNWKPTKARPKYRMTQREAVDKVAFSCVATPLDPVPVLMELTSVDTPPVLDIPAVIYTEPKPQPQAQVSLVSFNTPETPAPTPAPTPEPCTLLLLSTGLIGLAFLARWAA